MFTVSNLTKSLGERQLFTSISFSVNPGDRIGLVGPNGAGKSTLLRLIAGDEAPDAGAITRKPGLSFGFLRQGFTDAPDHTVADLIARTSPRTGAIVSSHVMVEAATDALAVAPPDDALTAALAAYDAAFTRFEALGGYPALDPVLTLLASLGLAGVPLTTPLPTLSGGQKTRAGLAALLAESPDLLLLDEPTNHLDLEALTWLETFLADFPGAAVVVSHDRAFLDRTVTTTLELDPDTRQLTGFTGGYSEYRAMKDAAGASLVAAYERQQRSIARISTDIRNVASHALQTERATQHDYLRGRAKKVARTAKVRSRKLERLLASEDKLDRPERVWGLDLEFTATPTGRDVVILNDVSVSLGGRSILREVNLHIRHGERVAITGSNGAGKSTLLRVITGELTPDAGVVRLGTGVVLGLHAQEQSTVRLDQTVLDQTRAITAISDTDARNYLHKFLFAGDAVFRTGTQLSYGERARLALALIMLRGANVLLLDEPLNHLDVPAREQFETALLAFPGTIIAVLHDRYAISRLADRIIEVRAGGVRERFDAAADASRAG